MTLRWLRNLVGPRGKDREKTRQLIGKPRWHPVKLYAERLEDRVTPSAGSLSNDSALLQQYGQLPMSFEVNQGQTDSQVQYLARGTGYSLFLTQGNAVLNLQNPGSGATGSAAAASAQTLTMSLVGANTAAPVSGQHQQPGQINYLIGNNPAQWHTDIPTYGRVAYQDVYPGVNLVYYGNQQQLEYDFTVAPGVDPGIIALAFTGATDLTLDAQGNLHLHTATGDVVEQAPVLYQESDGIRQPVSGHFVLEGVDHVGFAVGSYDTSEPLTIDPVLSYSTLLIGSDLDDPYGIAVDNSGDAYVVGTTWSTNFPTTNALQASNAGRNDIFVTKLNASGTGLAYSTYLGGSLGDDGLAIAVDSSGHAYIAGDTSSTNFPTTANAFQATAPGATSAAVVAELNAAGNGLIYSTYLGGTNSNNTARGIAVLNGNAYVTGSAGSTNFPTTAGVVQPTSISNNADFLTELNTTGTGLVYSTYICGIYNQNDANAVAVDSQGNAYVTGETTEDFAFPVTPGAYQSPTQGGTDVYVLKVNSTGTQYLYGTLFGGSQNDYSHGIAVDASGSAYITGEATSSNFPTTAGAFQTTLTNPRGEAFVAKINPTGSALDYSTYLGGSGGPSNVSSDVGNAIAIDGAGDAYVVGYTRSSDFPVANPTQPNLDLNISPQFYADAFVSVLNATGTALKFSTFLGGTGQDLGYGIAVDSSNSIYVTGSTDSSDFPTTPGAYETTAPNGTYDNGFVAKIANAVPISTYAESLNSTGVLTITQEVATANDSLAFTLSGGNYTFTDSNGLLFDTPTGSGAGSISGGVTSTITIPAASVTSIAVVLGTGTNVFNFTGTGGASAAPISVNTGTTAGDQVNITGAVLDSGAITLTSNAISESGAGDLNTTGTLTTNSVTGTTLTGANQVAALNTGNTTSGAISLTNTGALSISGISQAGGGNLIVSNSGAISQTGAISVAGGGTASISAGANAIDLTTNGSGNAFSGALALTNSGANNVNLTDSTALTLGTSAVGNGTLMVSAPGITQSGAVSQSASAGAVTFNAGAGAIALTNAGNSFTGAVAMNNSGANNVALSNSGDLALGASAVGSGTLTLTSGGSISQTGAVTQAAGAGTATFNAGSGAITLTSAGNSFTGAVALNNSGANNVALTNSGALLLGTSSLGSGTLALTAGGSISQSGPVTQASSAGTVTLTVTTASSDILLHTQANNLTGTVTFGGTLGNIRDVGLRNTSAGATLPTNLGSLTNLRNLTLEFDNAALSLPAITLTGNLLATAGGAISQTGDLSVPGTLTTNSVGGTILGLPGNAVATYSATNTGSGSIIVTNALAGLDVSAITETGGGSVTVDNTGSITVTGTVAAASGNVNLGAGAVLLESGAGLVTTSGTLTTASSGGTTLNGANTVDGYSATNTVAGNVSLTNTATTLSLGDITVSGGGGITVNNAGAILITGTVDAGSGPLYLAATATMSASTGGNVVVQVVLVPNTVADGTGPNMLVGNLSNTGTFIAGTLLVPTYTIPANEADNASFSLGTPSGSSFPVDTASGFLANYSVKPTYQLSVHLDLNITGLGPQVHTATINVTQLPPAVTINQAANQADPTNASTINFTVMFNESVSNFATGDVTLGGTAGATTAIVTGSGTTYNVAVSGMTQTGTVMATIPAGVAGNAAGTLNTASTSTDNTVTYDVTPPTVTINQAAGQADPTNAAPINFTVVFSKPVSNFATGTVTLGGTAGATTAIVTGSGATYNVAVEGMTGSGTVVATLAAGVAKDAAGNLSLASTSTENTVTYDVTPPTVTINQAAGQADPTNASPINFTVVFDKPVSNFATGAVTLGGTAGATTAIVTGSGATYNVAVSGMTGNGTVVATLAAGVAKDSAGNLSLASTSTDNTITYDVTPPTVTINQAASQADPTNAAPINFTVVFSKPVSNFATGDVTLSGTAGATTAIVTGSGTTYNVAVSGMTGSGTVVATLAAGIAKDAAGNLSLASTSTDNTVTYDVTPLTVTIGPAAGQTTLTNVSPINFSVVFSKPVSNFTGIDVTLAGTAGAANPIVTGSGTTYQVQVSATQNGTVVVSVPASVVTDAAGNPNTASTTSTVTYDTQPTTVTFNPVSSPRSSALASETIVFSEPVPGLTLSNLSLTQGGSANLLTAAQSLTTTDNITWTLGNLAGLPSLTHRVAGFTLALTTTGLTDLAGNAVLAPAPLSFVEVDSPLTLSGTTLTVPGTAGNDTFTFNAGPGEQLSLNGVSYTIDTTVVSAVQFQGNGGSDTATLNAFGPYSTATLSLGSGMLGGTVNSKPYSVSVSGVSSLTVNAGSALDYASFTDSSGSSIYTGAPTFSKLTRGTTLVTLAAGFASVAAMGTAGDTAYLVQGAGQYLVATHDYSLLQSHGQATAANEVLNFSTVIAYAAGSANDSAYLFSTSGSNHFLTTPTKADLITGAVVNEAQGFHYVVATSNSGGDGATFADTVGSNTYIGTPAYSYLVNGQSEALQEAIGFAFVYAADSSGGNDVATLTDATGKGGLSFLATPSYSLLSAGSTVLNELVGFPSVTAKDTAGGTDYATLYDAPQVATIFGGEATDAYVRAGAYYASAYGYTQVSAYATAGNQDRGYLTDSPAGATFLGKGNSAVLEGRPGYSLALYGYSSVVAYGSTGSNKLSLAAIDYLFSDVGTWTPV